MTARRRGRGFTLIELVIGMAIMVMLLLLAMPFTSAWIDGTRQMRARSNMLEAVGQARALAMRNPHACVGTDGGIVKLAYDAVGKTVAVYERAGDGCSGAWADAASWQGAIANPGELEMKASADAAFGDLDAFAAGSDFACAVFDSRGNRQLEPGCGAVSDTRVAIGVRNQGLVYVDLL